MIFNFYIVFSSPLSSSYIEFSPCFLRYRFRQARGEKPFTFLKYLEICLPSGCPSSYAISNTLLSVCSSISAIALQCASLISSLTLRPSDFLNLPQNTPPQQLNKLKLSIYTDLSTPKKSPLNFFLHIPICIIYLTP